MPTLVISWSAISPVGDDITLFEIHNNSAGVQIPPDACGFRLQRPGQLWSDGWYFASSNTLGSTFSFQSVLYSSSNLNLVAGDLIEARGPVGACAGSGQYVFVTPLGQLGIQGDDPIIAGAGAFIADFTSEDDITWLNSAGAEIEFPEPEVDIPTPVVPPEFFENLPTVKGCFRDFEDNLHCPDDADSADQAAMDMSGSNVSLLMSRNTRVLPGMGVVQEIAGRPQTVASGQALEITCPAELRLEVRFVKAADVPPANVRYRFRFAHGPMSTTFSRDVTEDGLTSVIHSVAMPLPAPINPPGGGGGTVGPATDELAIFRPPIDPLPPSGPSIPSGPAILRIEPLPDNEHKGSVRVEVVNGADGIIVSGWATYHLICAPGSGRGTVTPGLVGPSVLSLQVSLNRWLEEKDLPLLNADGRFARETERVVRQFQEEAGVDKDGVVGPLTWRALLSRTMRR